MSLYIGKNSIFFIMQYIELKVINTTTYGKTPIFPVKIINLHKNINEMLINC
jgi:hypothetical protein